jgi:Mn2+/Fe2+ NRAMP family transporter
MVVTNRLLPILFWSVITAAFIGPGTVTTCASAGANHRYALLWALLFSTFACVVLQEAAARLAVVSGRDLGQAIRERFHGGAAGIAVLLLVVGGVVVGCAAYQAGNVMGAVAGATLDRRIDPTIMTFGLGGIAAALLWFGKTRTVARALGGVVGVMGLAFLAVAIMLRPAPGELLQGVLLPTLPVGSGLLVLGLVGTTVVPYNLFLGSALARGQSMSEVRLGLGIAIPLGGVISMGILVTGAAGAAPFGFEAVASTLSGRLGAWGGPFFAFGLCAAGFTSAITAPLAAALTARALFAARGPKRWEDRSWRYRGVWLAVLLTGVVFGLTGTKPIPAILLAQALNGVLLPFVAVFLLIVLNDRRLMGEVGLNGHLSNVMMTVVVAVALVLGVAKGIGSLAAALGTPPLGTGPLLGLAAVVAAFLSTPIVRLVRRGRLGVVSRSPQP